MWLAYKLLAWVEKLQADINDIYAAIGALRSSSGGSGSGLVFTTGSGSPEGNVAGSPGDTYWDLDSGFKYTKVTGAGTTTGWMEH
jgi:hypothetical protein